MRGPLFSQLVRDRRMRLDARESLADLETMYTLIMEERGVADVYDITEFDERVTLAALCKLPWPGKRPSYSAALRSFISEYRGIADDEDLQRSFRSSIQPTLRLEEGDREDIRFEQLNESFHRLREGGRGR